MGCDLCGKSGSTRKTRIEGIVYDACSACAALGVDATPAQPLPKKRVRTSSKDAYEELFVRSDAGAVLRRAREKAKKTHEAFSQELNIKESLLHSWETGSRQPTVEMAKQLEKRLGVSLLESGVPAGDADTYRSSASSSGSGMTIADLLKKK